MDVRCLGRFGLGTSGPLPLCLSSVLANAKSRIFMTQERRLDASEGFWVEGPCRSTCWERDDVFDCRLDFAVDECRERAAEARLDVAGEGGAGREEVSDSRLGG